MKKEKDKEFDDLFKNKLENPDYDTGYLEDDWASFEQMLDKPKKRPGIIFWLPLLSAAAAVILFFAWGLFKPQAVVDNQQKQQAVVIQQKAVTNNVAVTTTPVDKTASNATNTAAQTNVQANAVNNTGVNKSNRISSLPNTIKANGLAVAVIKQQKTDIQNIKDGNTSTIVKNDQRTDATTLAAVKTNALLESASGNNVASLIPVENRDIVGNSYRPDPVKAEKPITKLGFVKRPQFALTVIGASELNGANSLGDSKSGTNIGLLFSAGVFNKLTVTTGANYSVKPYNTDIANYHTTYAFKTNPSEIEADCRVLDIPINVDYQLYNKHKNKFSIGSGLSSYIMLHESYNYYYTDPTTKGPVAFTVPNSGKYFFGILNLQATYQRQVNSKVGISIQPYMKLPLTNIGYSQVKLQTAGVAVGLNWNINSLTKP